MGLNKKLFHILVKIRIELMENDVLAAVIKPACEVVSVSEEELLSLVGF